MLLGTANAILYSSSGPLLRLVRIAELIPITLPSEFRSGPPELPGLRGTSVCIMSGIGRLSTLECPLSMPLTTPTPTELNSRKGLPIAIASCPGLTFDESANSRGSMSATSSGSTFKTARSSAELTPSFCALISRPSASRTMNSLPASTMCWFVIRCPWSSKKKPDPEDRPGIVMDPTVRETSISTTAWLASS